MHTRSARLTLTHLALGVYSFWNETFQQHMVNWSIGLLRNTFSADPLSPTQPEPIYYVMRTLSTVMDEASPTDMEIHFTHDIEKLEWYTFQKPDGQRMLAVWIRGSAFDDDSQELLGDITFPNVKLGDVAVLDVLNGSEQRLNVTYAGSNTLLKGLHIKDWPIIISGH